MIIPTKLQSKQFNLFSYALGFKIQSIGFFYFVVRNTNFFSKSNSKFMFTLKTCDFIILIFFIEILCFYSKDVNLKVAFKHKK